MQPAAIPMSRIARAGDACVLGVALAGFAVAASAQSSGTTSVQPATGSGASTPASKPQTAPRARIQLPAAGRRAIAAAEAAPSRTGEITRSELLPTPEDPQTALPEEPRTRIEQIRTSNRISEAIVTPALTGHPYVMTYREGRQSTSAVGDYSTLSIPKFFTFEFGKPTERPAAPLPPLPPPPSSNSR